MKRVFLIILTVMLLLGSLSSCTGNTSPKQSSGNDEKTSNGEKPNTIVTTIFPEYDWTMNILGDNPGGFEVKQILDNGVDMHSYQPSVEDILTISSCDLFIYVGGESDEWVEDVLKEANNNSMITINLLEVLGDRAKEEEHVEGMEEHEEEHDEHEDEHQEAELDEHIWLSLRNASICCDAIKDAIVSIDQENSDYYNSNLDGYKTELDNLDKEYKTIFDALSERTILVGDRFPFRYLVDDYDLEYFAAFAGCSAETEASFETVAFLSKKVDDLNLNNVIVIEGSDQKLADTIIRNTASKNQNVLILDSMQSSKPMDGKSYYDIMKSNLEVLRTALS